MFKTFNSWLNIFLLFGLLIMPLLSFAESKQKTTQNKVQQTAAKETWQTSTEGVHLSLTALSPEQIKAFYINRGFSQKQIESYAASCVFMTIFRNDSASGTIHFVSHNWDVSVKNNTLQKADLNQPLISVKEWLNRLQSSDVKKSSLIAFQWAQFPPEQSYEVGGDWNQGMLSMGLSPQTQFDLTAYWDIEGVAHQSQLKGVRCAK